MIIESLIVGPLEVNCFLIGDPHSMEAIIVDPGDEPERIIELIEGKALKVRYIVCTHAHFDHVGAIPEIKEYTASPVVIHKDDLEIYRSAHDMAAFLGFRMEPLPLPDLFVSGEDNISAGGLSFRVISTPGHSPGGICLYGNGIVVTGDTLFAGSVGRTDFHGGDINKLKESFNSLLSLPEDTEVLPGHGPKTTIGREREENFFVYESGWHKG
jgi:glyoxylase-like metal-dependent hydrolase (beta-lactamase superfamily II)